MSESKYTAREQIENFKAGNPPLDARCFYFYDWFCRDHLLEKKAKTLMSKAAIFAKLAGVDLDKTYIWFKNNCPMNGSLYDDFRFADLETGDIVWTVTPKCGHKSSNGAAEAWGPANGFEEPIHRGANWSDLLSKLV